MILPRDIHSKKNNNKKKKKKRKKKKKKKKKRKWSLYMAPATFFICLVVDLHGIVGFQIYPMVIFFYQKHESI